MSASKGADAATFQAAAAIRTSAYAMTQFAVSQSFGNAKRVKDLDESHR
jgi:hypothetical protein